jgi:hypothetical protein
MIPKVKSKNEKAEVGVSPCVPVKRIYNMKTISAICVICGCFYFTGCASTPPAVSPRPAADINTPTGMSAYLQRQKLPALKTVDLWESQFGSGLKLTTAHYEIYTTFLEPLTLSEVPGFVESAYRGYQNQLPTPIETSTPFTVYLFANRQQWEAFTIGFTGPQAPMYLKIKAGAYYLNGACVAYNIGLERTFSSLGHEGWHQFNSRLFKYRLPSWLDEGIAMQFEVSEYDGGFFTFKSDRNGYRLGPLKKTFLKNNVIPLKALIMLNPGEVVTEGDDAVGAFYSQAYALVRFLREDEYGKRLPQYQKLLFDGLSGQWPLAERDVRIAADRNIPITVGWNSAVGKMLFEHYIIDHESAVKKTESDREVIPFDKIEKQYLTFCKKVVYHVRLK